MLAQNKLILHFFKKNKDMSSRPEVCCKKDALRDFEKFTGKHLYQSLFLSKVPGLRSATLLKRRLWHRCFSVNFAKSLRTPFLTEHFRWLLLSKQHRTNSKINSKYLGDKLFLKIFYVIKVLAH